MHCSRQIQSFYYLSSIVMKVANISFVFSFTTQIGVYCFPSVVHTLCEEMKVNRGGKLNFFTFMFCYAE